MPLRYRIAPQRYALVFSTSNLPDGASFRQYIPPLTDVYNDSGTYIQIQNAQLFSWKPDYSQAGTYKVGFTVTDDTLRIQSLPTDGGSSEGSIIFEGPGYSKPDYSGGLSDSEEITITVKDTNRPPVLAEIGDKIVKEGSILEFTVSATDLDNDSIDYAASNLPEGAILLMPNMSAEAGGDSGTDINKEAIFSWTPDLGQAGTFTNIIFTVSDDGMPQLDDSEEINITVNNHPQVEIIIDNSDPGFQPAPC